MSLPKKLQAEIEEVEQKYFNITNSRPARGLFRFPHSTVPAKNERDLNDLMDLKEIKGDTEIDVKFLEPFIETKRNAQNYNDFIDFVSKYHGDKAHNPAMQKHFIDTFPEIAKDKFAGAQKMADKEKILTKISLFGGPYDRESALFLMAAKRHHFGSYHAEDLTDEPEKIKDMHMEEISELYANIDKKGNVVKNKPSFQYYTGGDNFKISDIEITPLKDAYRFNEVVTVKFNMMPLKKNLTAATKIFYTNPNLGNSNPSVLGYVQKNQKKNITIGIRLVETGIYKIKIEDEQIYVVLTKTFVLANMVPSNPKNPPSRFQPPPKAQPPPNDQPPPNNQPPPKAQPPPNNQPPPKAQPPPNNQPPPKAQPPPNNQPPPKAQPPPNDQPPPKINKGKKKIPEPAGAETNELGERILRSYPNDELFQKLNNEEKQERYNFTKTASELATRLIILKDDITLDVQSDKLNETIVKRRNEISQLAEKEKAAIKKATETKIAGIAKFRVDETKAQLLANHYAEQQKKNLEYVDKQTERLYSKLRQIEDETGGDYDVLAENDYDLEIQAEHDLLERTKDEINREEQKISEMLDEFPIKINNAADLAEEENKFRSIYKQIRLKFNNYVNQLENFDKKENNFLKHEDIEDYVSTLRGQFEENEQKRLKALASAIEFTNEKLLDEKYKKNLDTEWQKTQKLLADAEAETKKLIDYAKNKEAVLIFSQDPEAVDKSMSEFNTNFQIIVKKIKDYDQNMIRFLRIGIQNPEKFDQQREETKAQYEDALGKLKDQWETMTKRTKDNIAKNQTMIKNIKDRSSIAEIPPKQVPKQPEQPVTINRPQVKKRITPTQIPVEPPKNVVKQAPTPQRTPPPKTSEIPITQKILKKKEIEERLDQISEAEFKRLQEAVVAAKKNQSVPGKDLMAKDAEKIKDEKGENLEFSISRSEDSDEENSDDRAFIASEDSEEIEEDDSTESPPEDTELPKVSFKKLGIKKEQVLNRYEELRRDRIPEDKVKNDEDSYQPGVYRPFSLDEFAIFRHLYVKTNLPSPYEIVKDDYNKSKKAVKKSQAYYDVLKKGPDKWTANDLETYAGLKNIKNFDAVLAKRKRDLIEKKNERDLAKLRRDVKKEEFLKPIQKLLQIKKLVNAGKMTKERATKEINEEFFREHGVDVDNGKINFKRRIVHYLNILGLRDKLILDAAYEKFMDNKMREEFTKIRKPPAKPPQKKSTKKSKK